MCVAYTHTYTHTPVRTCTHAALFAGFSMICVVELGVPDCASAVVCACLGLGLGLGVGVRACACVCCACLGIEFSRHD